MLEFLTETTTGPLVGFVLVFLAVWIARIWWENSSLPPGPWGLPFVGYVPFMETSVNNTYQKLSKKYGDVFSLRLGSELVVVVSGYDLIKEVFTKNGDIVNGKSQKFTILGWFGNFEGIFEDEGDVWRDERRFILSTLRDFGFGKNMVAENIQHEAEYIIDLFNQKKGKPFDPEHTFVCCSINIINKLLFNQQLNYDDPQFKALSERFDLNRIPSSVAYLVKLPWLRHIPVVRSFLGWDYLVDMKKRIYCFIEAQLQQHIETLDENNVRDFIDASLLEYKSGKSQWLNYGRVKTNAWALYIAAHETISNTLHWGIKLVMVHTDVQRKIQEELDNVVGRSRLPSWSDRTKLPYTEATIMEIQRYSSIVPINDPHYNIEEITIKGYRIPRRTLILSNLDSALFDPTYWINPNEFDPNNFYDDGKIKKNEAFIPFAIGRRACPGESLAKMELFILFATLMHRFTFKSPEGTKVSFESPENVFNLRYPLPYDVCAIPRP